MKLVGYFFTMSPSKGTGLVCKPYSTTGAKVWINGGLLDK